jgi:hypothetical protein
MSRFEPKLKLGQLLLGAFCSRALREFDEERKLTQVPVRSPAVSVFNAEEVKSFVER